jgi:membrane protein DedA with SNARE-associated domain
VEPNEQADRPEGEANQVAEPAEPAEPRTQNTPDQNTPVEDSPDQDTPDQKAQPEWWEDPRMPWKGKPSRSDVWCWVGFSLTGLYSLVLLPLRPVLLGANPYLLAALGGSRTSAVTIGALAAATGYGWWPLGLLLAVFGSVKFDPLYWWAGKLWGRGLIELVAGRSARAARNAARAERLAARYGAAAVLLTYVIPLPSAVVIATVAAAGMRLRTFLLIDLTGATVTRAIYIYLGYRIGQPAVDVVNVIAKYSLWISLALLAGIIVNAVRQQHTKKAA